MTPSPISVILESAFLPNHFSLRFSSIIKSCAPGICFLMTDLEGTSAITVNPPVLYNHGAWPAPLISYTHCAGFISRLHGFDDFFHPYGIPGLPPSSHPKPAHTVHHRSGTAIADFPECEIAGVLECFIKSITVKFSCFVLPASNDFETIFQVVDRLSGFSVANWLWSLVYILPVLFRSRVKVLLFPLCPHLL